MALFFFLHQNFFPPKIVRAICMVSLEKMMSSLFIKFGQRGTESGIKGSNIQECGIWNDSVTPQNFQSILGTQPQEYFLDQKHLCVYTDKSLAEICSCLASAPSHPSQSQPANCSPDVLTLTQRCPLCWETAANEPLPSVAYPEHASRMIDWVAGCSVSPTTIPNPEKMLHCKRKQMWMGLLRVYQGEKAEFFFSFFY